MIQVPTVIQQAPVIVQQPPVVVQQPATVIQQAPAVIQQPAPTIIQQAPAVVAPAQTVPVPHPTPVPHFSSLAQKASRITVVVPADARLWVDAVECPLVSTVRSFNTPELNPNQRYTYTMKVTLVRDGRTITESQRVLITPGQEARVDFNSAIAQRIATSR